MTPASFLMAAISSFFAYGLALSPAWQLTFGFCGISAVLLLAEELQ
jgi:hypothetical protein